MIAIVRKGTSCVCLVAIVNDTHTGQLTATIDILFHSAAYDVYVGIATHGASPLHRRIGVVRSSIIPVYLNGGRMVIIIAAVAAAIDTATDDGSTRFCDDASLCIPCSANGHVCIFTHSTILATAIHIAGDFRRRAADVNCSGLRLSQFRP